MTSMDVPIISPEIYQLRMEISNLKRNLQEKERVLSTVETRLIPGVVSRGGDKIHFCVDVSLCVSEEQAKEIQISLGYHPVLHDFINYRASKIIDKTTVSDCVRWSCYAPGL